MNPLRNVIDQFTCEQKCPPYKIKKYVEDLENRINRLIASATELGKCKEIKEQLNEVKTSLKRDVEQNKLSFFNKNNDLKDLSPQNCLKKTAELQTLSEKEDLDYKLLKELLSIISESCKEKLKECKGVLVDYSPENQVSDSWFRLLSTWSKEDFFNNKEFLEKIFEKAREKCEKIKDKFELQKDKIDLDDDITKSVISRLNHLISPDKISKVIYNSENEPICENKHKELQSILDTSYIAYKSLEAFIEINLISSKIMPELDVFSKKITSLNEYLINLDDCLKDFSIFLKNLHHFILNSENLNYKPVFSLEKMQKYADLKKQFDTNVKILNDFEISKNELSRKIDEANKEISSAIEKITSHKNFPTHVEVVVEEIPFENEKSVMSKRVALNVFDDYPMGKNSNQEQDHRYFPDLLLHTSKDLQSLRNEIKQKWDHCHSEIETIKCRKEIYASFNELSENLNLCYFLAQNLYENINRLISSENNKSTHITTLKTYVQDFKILYNLISDISRYDVNLQEISDEKFKKLNNILGKEFNECLSSHYYQSICSSSKLSSSLHEIYYNVENKGIDEFTKRKENLRLEFKELDKFCDLIVKQIDRGRQAVAAYGNNHSYDDCFTQAYPSETRTIEIVQNFGSSIKKGLTYGSSFIGLGSSQESQIEEYSIDEVISPFTHWKHLLKL